jgi:purine-nucleoside phosphorylase
MDYKSGIHAILLWKEIPMPKRPVRHDYEDVLAAAAYLRGRVASFPRAAVLAGTGLGDLAGALQDPLSIDYQLIPNFPVSTVQSHAGRLLCGRLGGQELAVLQGRFHLYEGYSPRAVTFPIRVLQALGVRTLILTNASGGLNPTYAVGDIMIISDHINLTGANPLTGPEEARWGVRFPDMTAAYAHEFREAAQHTADSQGIRVRQGVYAGLPGPSLETPAEMRYLRLIGADAVGFSTVLESIAAVHGGMQVLGLSTITNLCLPDLPAPAGVDAIIAAAHAAAPRVATLIAEALTIIHIQSRDMPYP